ncbi:hypothetical protein [Streptomyces sp. NPDC102360]|uniref:hypothetical protein n=1 Tax=Streptomyces sp. NPDC102360 TaxID=3366160 RepID=UPI0038202482
MNRNIGIVIAATALTILVSSMAMIVAGQAAAIATLLAPALAVAVQQILHAVRRPAAPAADAPETRPVPKCGEGKTS